MKKQKVILQGSKLSFPDNRAVSVGVEKGNPDSDIFFTFERRINKDDIEMVKDMATSTFQTPTVEVQVKGTIVKTQLRLSLKSAEALHFLTGEIIKDIQEGAK